MKSRKFWANEVRSISSSGKDTMIPKTRGNHSGTLGTTRTSCDNFTNGKGHRGPVKINGEGRGRKGIGGGRLLGALISF